MSTNFSLTTASPQVNVIQSINYLLATQGNSAATYSNANVVVGNTVVQANTSTGQVYTTGGGVISYLYGFLDVAYANTATGGSFSSNCTNKSYYGVRNSTSPIWDTNPVDYQWTQVAGGFGTTRGLYYQNLGGGAVAFSIGSSPLTNLYTPVIDSTPIVLATLVQPGTITNVQIATATITNVQIAANTITSTNIQQYAIQALNIANAAITNAQIQQNTLTTGLFAANAITSNIIAYGAVNGFNVHQNTLTGNLIAQNTITGNLVAQQTLTGNLIAQNTITGNLVALNTITGNLIAQNTITGNLIVPGTIYGNAIIANTLSGNTILAGTLYGNAVITNSLNANTIQANTFQANTIQGSAIVAGSITATQLAANVLTVGNIISFGSTIESPTGTGYWLDYTNGNVYFGGNTTVGNNLKVGTNAQIGNNLTVGQNVQIGANLNVSGLINGGSLNSNTVGSSQLQDGSIGNSKIIAGTINAATALLNQSLTNAQIALGTIQGSSIASATITGSLIAGSTITGSLIAGSTITGSLIAGSTITGSLIATGTITGTNIQAGSITATQINGAGLTITNGSSPAISGNTMTGAGALLNGSGTFALGSSNNNLVYNGTYLSLNGSSTINISGPLKTTGVATFDGTSGSVPVSGLGSGAVIANGLGNTNSGLVGYGNGTNIFTQGYGVVGYGNNNYSGGVYAYSQGNQPGLNAVNYNGGGSALSASYVGITNPGYAMTVSGDSIFAGNLNISTGYFKYDGTTIQAPPGSNSYFLAGDGTWPAISSVISGVSSAAAGSGISISGTGSGPYTGAITVTNNGVLSFNSRTGAVTLSSSDVTGALGYTPYNAGGATVLTTSNYNSYTPTLTGGGASGTWGINVTGSAGSASSYSGSIAASQITSGVIDISHITTSPSSTQGVLYNSGSGIVTSENALVSIIDTNTGSPSSQVMAQGFTVALYGSSTVSGLTLQSVAANTAVPPTVTLSLSGSYTGTLTSSQITSALGYTPGVGTVTSVSASSPLSSTGGNTPTISISQAGASTNGYLSSTDWNTFNNKGYGTVTSVSGTGTVSGLTLSGTVTGSGSLTLGGTLSAPASAITSGTINQSVLFGTNPNTGLRQNGILYWDGSSSTVYTDQSIDTFSVADSGTATASAFTTNYKGGSGVSGLSITTSASSNTVSFNLGGSLTLTSSQITTGLGYTPYNAGGATVLTTSNYNSYTPTLSGGGAYGNWSINVTGSAGSASTVPASGITGTISQSQLTASAPGGSYFLSGGGWTTVSVVSSLNGATGAVTNSFAAVNSFGSPVGFTVSGSGTNSVTYTISNTSDQTLKKNIQPIDLGLDFIRKLKPVTFNWDTPIMPSTCKMYGFVAQDVLAAADNQESSIVYTNDVGEFAGKLAVGNEGITAALTKGVNELADIVDQQAALITQLTARLAALEAKQ